jgi:hypothetical protein
VVDTTVIDVLKNHGIIVNFKDRWKYHSTRKTATKRLIMDGVQLNDNARTNYFNLCILNSSYPKVKVEGMDQFRSDKPKHDSTSHYRSSLEYMALGLEDFKPRVARPYDKFPKKEQKTRGRGRRAVGF